MGKKIQLFLVCNVFMLFLFSCNSDESPIHRIQKNKNVIYAEILESKLDVFYDKYDIEIHTTDGYKIILHNVKWPLNNKGICISEINGICCYGGKIYEILEETKLFYDPRDIEVLGKMLEKKIKSVDDVINNIDELYNLYKIFESNSRKEFIYKDRFLINADFKYVDSN